MDVRTTVLELMKVSRMDTQRLAVESGVSYGRLLRMLDGDRTAPLETWDKVLRVYGLRTEITLVQV